MMNLRRRILCVKWPFVILTVITCGSVLCVENEEMPIKPFDPNAPLVTADLWALGMNVIDIREKTRVRLNEFPELESYAGFLKVTREGSKDWNGFFWYFKAEQADDPNKAPVVLYLEDSMDKNLFYSVFEENGPFTLAPNGSLARRAQSLNNKHHAIYIDSLVGSGYTFSKNRTRSSTEYPDDTIITYRLREALNEFYDVFPELRENNLFLVGSRRSSRFVLNLAKNVIFENSHPRAKAQKKIHLKGLVCANGPMIPEHQLFFGHYLYNVGLINDQGLAQFKQQETAILDHMRHQRYAEAYDGLTNLMTGERSLFKTLTGHAHPFNILEAEESELNSISRISQWVQRPETRRALHVGDDAAYGEFNREVPNQSKYLALKNETWKHFDELLRNYRILFYTGELDILYPYPAMEHAINTWKWSGRKDHETANRQLWQLDHRQLAGYIKQTGNFTEALILKAGHYPFIDQPRSTLDLLERFTHQQL